MEESGTGASEVRVRRGGREDDSTLTRFNVAMADETEGKVLDPHVVSAGVRALIDDPKKGFYLVAEREGEIAGSLMITTEWSDWRDGDFWWIQSVYVEKAHRRKGVFQALYDEARAQAHQGPRVCGIRLYVEKDNARARKTYDAVGMGETPYRLYETEMNSREGGKE